MDVTERRFSALTKEDCRKLQVLQNKVLRLKIRNFDRNVPTTELLLAAEDLSVQQLGAFHTAVNVFKITQSGQPKYLAEKLVTPPHGQHLSFQVNCKLNISRSGFLFRGAKIWNLLPSDLKQEPKVGTFKIKLKKWIIANIPAKPP